MKSSAHAQSATSLPRAPRDEASARSIRYLITMGIRVACFALMVFITPYGWYTWVFAGAAIFLPYIAVVIANVGSDVRTTGAENPERALPAAPTAPTSAPLAGAAPASADQPRVIRLSESSPPPPRRADGERGEYEA